VNESGGRYAIVALAALALSGCGADPVPVAGRFHQAPAAPAGLVAPSSAGPSSAAPSSVAPSSVAPRARVNAKPGPDNTGVPAGVALRVVTGDQVFTTDNQVVSGLDIRGYVRIRAHNVTIMNSIIRGGAPRCNAAVLFVESGQSATIQDSEISPSQPNACLDGIWATNANLWRLDIHHVVDGVKAFDNVKLRESYIHDLSWFASDPNQGGGPTHNDTVQTYQGNRNVFIVQNTLLAGTKGNAAYQVTQDGGRASTNLRIEKNWLDGGGCTLNFSHKGGPVPMTGIYVIGNRFGRGSTFNCPILISTQTVLTQNTGNVWDDTGTPIPSPQQHD
jgi:hypothetical protein